MKDDCGYFHGYGQTRDKSIPLFDPSVRKPQGDRSDAYKGINQDKDKEQEEVELTKEQRLVLKEEQRRQQEKDSQL